MKKILLTLSLLVLLALEVGIFVFFYLKLDQFEDRITNLEEVVDKLPTPQSNGQFGQNQNTGVNTNAGGSTKTGENGQLGQPGQLTASGTNPLANHDTHITYSDDPETITSSDDPIFEGASVPEVVRLSNGDLLLYFVDAEGLEAGNTEQIGYSKSTDNGATWSEKEQVIFSGKLNEGPAVDPSVVELEDGTLRMYFYGPDGPISELGADTAEHNVYSAVSEDGINFAVEEGIRFSAQKLTDPEVIYHQGRWIMYVSLITSTGIATSDDGLTWTDTEVVWDGGGVPGAFVDSEDLVHLYGCSPTGLQTASSTDGTTFETVTTAMSAGGICDPSPVLLDDGSMIMVYKQIDQ